MLHECGKISRSETAFCDILLFISEATIVTRFDFNFLEGKTPTRFVSARGRISIKLDALLIE